MGRPRLKDKKKSESDLSGRSLKSRIIEALGSKNFDSGVREISDLPIRRAVNPLFSLLYSSDQDMKWKAVKMMGVLIDRLASQDIESARVIMRRLMWNLNDESGGIGWGSAEAMGEILAINETLAEEYSSILLSYAREDGNFQELESMQRGVLWGILRLAQVRPHLVKESVPFVIPFLSSKDSVVRGTAAWIIGTIGDSGAVGHLERLLNDDGEIKIFIDDRLCERRVKDIVKEAIENVSA
jgi:hypothetical protein